MVLVGWPASEVGPQPRTQAMKLGAKVVETWSPRTEAEVAQSATITAVSFIVAAVGGAGGRSCTIRKPPNLRLRHTLFAELARLSLARSARHTVGKGCTVVSVGMRFVGAARPRGGGRAALVRAASATALAS
jgi:hypothetical protein